MHHDSAHDLRLKFCESSRSAEEIVSSSFQAIAKYDSKVQAFLRTFETRALKKAKQLDEKKKQGRPLGKLAGVPIAIKDNIHINREITSCGSLFLEHYRAVFDATAVRLLEEADALIIGKTNLDEFAMGSSTENSAYQITKNPWDLNCSPGGSSGGSAAAVAARMCPIALGTDTGGSIRQPAALCGIVGFKPTYGRVSRYGLVAFASSLDHIGPLTRTVLDTALVMEVLGSHCKQDSTSLDVPQENYLQKIHEEMGALTIGVPWEFLELLEGESRTHFLQSVETLKALGAEIIDVNLGMLKYSLATYYILATAEASTNLARFDGIRYGKRSPRATTLDEVYDFSRQEGFGEEVKQRILLGTYVLSSGHKEAFYKKAQQVRSLTKEQFKNAFAHCSLIAMPTAPSPAFPVGTIHDPVQMYLQDIFTICANLAGIPAISIPSGFSAEGLPLGLQFIGPPLGDAKVLQCAYAVEKALNIKDRLPPLIGGSKP